MYAECLKAGHLLLHDIDWQWLWSQSCAIVFVREGYEWHLMFLHSAFYFLFFTRMHYNNFFFFSIVFAQNVAMVQMKVSGDECSPDIAVASTNWMVLLKPLS